MDAVTLSVKMSIYTRTGDDGTTSLYGGKRVSKANPQVEAYGSLDELSSVLGIVISFHPNKQHVAFLSNIQGQLHGIMAYVSGARIDLTRYNIKTSLIEKKIDEITKTLPPLSKFILPQGTQISVFFHLARTVCRRAERHIVAYMQNQPKINKKLLIVVGYLNRLSDLLFMLARTYNTKHEETV